MTILYSYWRSSASYRVRIALNLKGVKADTVPVNLLKGEQKKTSYTVLNPQGRVPALLDEGEIFTQSLAIIEYLDEKYPQPALLPVALGARARVRAIALAIACDISPMGNLAPQRYLTEQLGISGEQKDMWLRHWMHEGLATLETMLTSDSQTGTFCHGASPTLADCCLVPQLYNARRYHLDLMPFPTLLNIDAACAKLPAFIAAHPDNQPDTV